MPHYPMQKRVRIAYPVEKCDLGTIMRRNGEYYYVMLDNSVEVERYQSELTLVDPIDQQEADAEERRFREVVAAMQFPK